MNKLIQATIIIIVMVIASRDGICEIDHDTEVFGLYTATLDGNNMEPLITSSWQQMTHARVSPDGNWITFTRYNNIGKDGYATENPNNYDNPDEQYLDTEIMIMRVDGTDLRSLIPPREERAAANSYWTPDGKGLIYISAPNAMGLPQINHIILNDDMEIEMISKIPIPEYIAAVDPHWVGDWVVFPGHDIINETKGIWRIKYYGEELELLAETPDVPFVQDNDPKFSPDSSQVAFMRRMKEGFFWHVFVVDVETKVAKDISAGYLPENVLAAAEAVPTWSGNGKFLIFDHIIIGLTKSVNEIRTMKPDGTQRKRIPLPEEFTYFHPNIFPYEGSGENSRIIFSTHRKDVSTYEKISIIGETSSSRIDDASLDYQNGVYDPSLEYEKSGEVGWMAYSSVDVPKYIGTHLAKTLDHGKTWTLVKIINPSPDGTVLLDGQEIEGSWWNEVSTLVHDPDDPGREWKLFWHKYFATHIPEAGAGNRVFQYSWIAYKYTSDPAGEWSEEIPLFGAGSFPLEPYKTKFNLNELHSDLKDFITYTEPGSIYKDGVLYLSLQGHKFVDEVNIAKIILLASQDHGQTWSYVSTLLENDDAKKFDATIFTGSSLVEENSRVFLLATPEDPGWNVLEASDKGVVIFEFENISQGRLKKDKDDELVVIKYLKPLLTTGGKSDYDEHNTYGGIVMPQLNFAAYPEVFQIFNTKEKIVEEGFILGDVSVNGDISNFDTSLAARYVVGIVSLTQEKLI